MLLPGRICLFVLLCVCFGSGHFSCNIHIHQEGSDLRSLRILLQVTEQVNLAQFLFHFNIMTSLYFVPVCRLCRFCECLDYFFVHYELYPYHRKIHIFTFIFNTKIVRADSRIITAASFITTAHVVREAQNSYYEWRRNTKTNTCASPCLNLSVNAKPQREIYLSLHQAVCYVLTGFKGSEFKLPREWRGVNSFTIRY